MSNPYIGEIRIFAGNFAPIGWGFCEGQLVPISEYEALFTLIGTTYGGDGQETFALPDLRGRVPVHQGTNNQGSTRVLGESYGSETVTLTSQQLPAHGHALRGSSGVGNVGSPANAVLAATTANAYGNGVPNSPMSPSTLTASGTLNPQPHDNMAPFLTVHYIMALWGVFPSPN